VRPEELHERLVELAQAAGLVVRRVPGRAPGAPEPPAASAVCRVQGEVWVVLSAADAVEERCSVLVRALREHAAGFLEDRYLPPALRERLEVREDPEGRKGREGRNGQGEGRSGSA